MASDSYMPVAAEGLPGFSGRMALRELGSLSLSEARVAPLRTSGGGPIDRDDMLQFCIHLSGMGLLRQRDRAAELGPGVGVLYEARSPWVLDFATNTRSLLLQFPREALPLRSSHIAEGIAHRLDPQLPAMRLLTGYVEQLFQLSDDIPADQRHDAGQAALEIVSMALRGLSPSVPCEQSAGEVLLGLMCSYIKENLSDPRLTVAGLARRHHISVRHVHSVFAGLGVTPGTYIREQRLMAARTLLASDRRPVADIGASVGFLDRRTFERAFQRHFGVTPAGWRQDHYPE
jgi:AraC-like DNA-binding protein